MGELDGTLFMGRKLYLRPGRKGREQPKKEEEEAQKKEQAPKLIPRRERGGKAAWSTLFLHPDTVASVVAEEMGVQKG